MTAVQDMYIDLMHVLYVYSRVMGGGVITKYSRVPGIVGYQVHVCICGILEIYKTHVHAV